jgi:hypothetical protein
MPKISFQKTDIPFLFGDTGQLTVDTGDLQVTQPPDPSNPTLLKANFDASGSQKFSLGGDNTVQLGVTASTSLELVSIFSTTQGASRDLLAANDIGQFFDKPVNSDKIVLGLNVGGSAQLTASGSFNYSALKAGFELNAGADGGYTYLRALTNAPIVPLLKDFFSRMRLPEQASASIQAGEALSLRYSGYLKLAAEASAGYELAGTKSVALGQLALSEKYDLSILGKVGLTGSIAGQYSIIVSGSDELAGWARVHVHRDKSTSFGVAADVNVGFKNQLDNLPSNANEFLGAALGVNAKNFLNVFQKARELSDFDKFKAAIDGLAQRYISEYVDKGFNELSSVSEFTSFLDSVNKVVTSYQQLGDRAVTLFDRYFDQIPDLTAFLNRIQGLGAGGLDTLRKDLGPTAWNILSQLTDGDPLGFLLQQVSVGGVKIDALSELQKRAGSVLDLIKSAAHDEIRKAVALAKQSFGLDTFFSDLAKIDTVDELKSLANEKIGQFVTRLVGRSLDSSANIKLAFQEVQAVLTKIDGFKDKLYSAFKEALNSSYTVALHAEYSRTSETDALVDVLINLAQPASADLLAQAGKGDFEQILSTADTNLVRLREGVFTHRTRRESAFKVNIIGWHLNYNYEGFDRVITEVEQRLVPSDRGITVFTTADLQVERMRKRQNEQMHVNFLLRAIGESAKAVKADGRTGSYLIDALNSLTARYELSFTDDDTSATELQDYLAFAKDVGLDSKGATLSVLDPLLPRAANGGFGKIQTSYDIRFGEKAVTALSTLKAVSPQMEQSIRTSMRHMVLSNYLKTDGMHDVAFAYATPGVFDLFKTEGFAEFTNHFQRTFNVTLPNFPIFAPATVTLDRTELNFVQTLYQIETSMVDSFRDLTQLMSSGASIDPQTFEKKLGKFGSALELFDKFDQTTNDHGIGTNTIFLMFDMLVRLAAPGGNANVSMLTLDSEANGKQVEKIFVSDEAAEVAPAMASAGGTGG